MTSYDILLPPLSTFTGSTACGNIPKGAKVFPSKTTFLVCHDVSLCARENCLDSHQVKIDVMKHGYFMGFPVFLLGRLEEKPQEKNNMYDNNGTYQYC